RPRCARRMVRRILEASVDDRDCAESLVSPAMTTSPGITESLATFIERTNAPAVPELVFERACKATVDAFAAIVAGATSEVAAPLLKYVDRSGGKGEAVVLGTAVTTTPEFAALANGDFGAALEYDDVF